MLEISYNLFENLNLTGIRYCQFKSTDHIKEGLDGTTDLDLLIDAGDQAAFQTLVSNFGFRPTVSGYGASDHSREGYLGLDESTGKFVYLDVHYSMIIGADRVRELHSSRIADTILENRIKHSEYNIYIPRPEDELSLLFIRMCLKTSLLRYLNAKFGKSGFLAAWNEEKEFLLSQADASKPNSFIDDPAFSDYYHRFLDGKSNISDTRACSKLISQAYFMKRSRLGTHVSFILKSAYAALSRLSRKTNRLGHHFPRKVFRNAGPMIVFIGIDGSGKSTQMKRVSKKLGWKMDVAKTYLGAGDGSLSLPFRILKKLKSVLIDRRPPPKSSAQKSSETPFSNTRKVLWPRVIWSVFLARDKVVKFRKIQKLRSHGITVLCDRFPQTHVPGFNDGNLLGAYLEAENEIVRRLAHWEKRVYQAAFVDRPTLFIHLDIPIEVANTRDRTGNAEYLIRRKSCVDQFKDSFKPVVRIDADLPVEVVTTSILNAIWKSRW